MLNIIFVHMREKEGKLVNEYYHVLLKYWRFVVFHGLTDCEGL